jgi:hypothetical protein
MRQQQHVHNARQSLMPNLRQPSTHFPVCIASRLLLVFGVMVVPTHASSAQTVTWRNLTVAVPAGWVVRRSTEEVLNLQRGTTAASSALIIVAPYTATSVTPASVVSLGALAAGPNAVQPRDVRDAFLRDGTPVLYAYGSTQLQGTSATVFPLIVHGPRLSLSIVLIEIGDRSSDSDERSLGAVLASLAGSAPSGTITPGAARNTAFFARIGPTVVVNPIGGAAPGIGVIEMSLLPDRRFVLAAPHDIGDPDRYCTTHVTDCGSYQIRDGAFSRLRSRTAFEERFGLVGEDLREPYQSLRNGDLQLGTDRWYRIAPIAGTPLNGDFVGTSGGTSTTATGGTSTLLTETTYRFRPDGRVWEGGYSAFTGASGDAFPDSRIAMTVGGTLRTKQGRYRFDGYSLTITWDNGTGERISGYLLDGVLIADGKAYTPRGGRSR